MSKPKFTKEKWEIVDSPIGVREISAEKIPICIMAMTDYYGVSEEEKMANASLIIAAPDLYKDEENKIVQLKTLKSQILSLIGTGLVMPPAPMLTSDDVLGFIDSIIKETTKLLKKARGEAHEKH